MELEKVVLLLVKSGKFIIDKTKVPDGSYYIIDKDTFDDFCRADFETYQSDINMILVDFTQEQLGKPFPEFIEIEGIKYYRYSRIELYPEHVAYVSYLTPDEELQELPEPNDTT